MGRVDELIEGFANVLKGPVKELPRDKYRRYFDIRALFLSDDQMIRMSTIERQSGTIDFEFAFRIGQITSPDCCLELLEMNYLGIKSTYFAAIEDSDNPVGLLLWLKHSFSVPASTPIQEAIDIFRGDFLALAMPVRWPDDVLIWSKKEK